MRSLNALRKLMKPKTSKIDVFFFYFFFYDDDDDYFFVLFYFILFFGDSMSEVKKERKWKSCSMMHKTICPNK